MLNLLGRRTRSDLRGANYIVWGNVADWSSSYYVVWGNTIAVPVGQYIVWGNSEFDDPTTSSGATRMPRRASSRS